MTDKDNMTDTLREPELGDIVIYLDEIANEHAAIVTSVCDPEECAPNTVGLVAFNDFGMKFLDHVAHGAEPETWQYRDTV